MNKSILRLPLVLLVAAPLMADQTPATAGQHSEAYQSLTFNGSWSNHSTPKSLYQTGNTPASYAGWIDNAGNITVGKYKHSTGAITTKVLQKNVIVDARNNPSLLINEEGHLIVFYQKNGKICSMRSSKANDISQWDAEITIAPTQTKANSNSYPSLSPILLAKGAGVLLFHTNEQGQPMYSYSPDQGANWISTRPLIKEAVSSLKAYSKDGQRIHLALTDSESGIYYQAYKASELLGTKVIETSLQELKTIGTRNTTLWDMAENAQGDIVLAYSISENATKHLYYYTTWNGQQWSLNCMCESGGTFIKPLVTTGIETPFEAAGMAIDHENPNEVYISIKRDKVFEIEQWSFDTSPSQWNVTSITSGSEKDNVRPQSVIGAQAGNPLQVMWMTNTNYYSNQYPTASKLHWADRYQSAIKMGINSPAISNCLEPEQIKQLMRQTADWQFANPYDLRRLTDWHWGTYFVGLEELYQLTGDDRYKQEMINIGDGAKWRTNDQILYVDMVTIISNWAWLYEHEKDPKMIEQSQWALDVHLRTRRKERADVRFANNPYFDEWWTWCDALFVAPPAFAAMYHATGERKYLDYMDQMYWLTYDYLYSKEDHLVFRDDRYFTQRSENGKKIFWGRGNGWVIAGLCRIINMMPENYPTRGKYEEAFKNLSHKLLEIQSADGGWRVSLLDPEYQDEAEMSGSAFIVYALAWGINRGLLEEKYLPQVIKGWETMCKNVNENGRFGNVQSEGIDPRNFTESDWQVYGTGAFLMAGAEMYRLMGGKK